MRTFKSVPVEVRAEQWFPPQHEAHKPIAGVQFQRNRYWVRDINGRVVEILPGQWAVQEPGSEQLDPADIRLYPVNDAIFQHRYKPC